MKRVFDRVLFRLFLGGLSVAVTATYSAAFNGRDFLQRTSVSDIALEPSGRKLVFAQETPNLVHNRIDRSVWLLALREGSKTKLPIDDGTLFDWEADGRAFLFRRQGDLVAWNVETHSAQTIVPRAKLLALFQGAASVDIQEIHCAPTGDLVALVVDVVGKVNDRPETAVEVKSGWNLPPDTTLPSIVSPTSTSRLVVIDRNTGNIARMLDQRYTMTAGFGRAADWAPDGRRLVFSAATSIPVGDTNEEMFSDLFLWDVGANKISTLVSETGPDFDPYWSPDGKTIAFLTSAGKFDYFYNWQVGFIDMSHAAPHLSFPIKNPGNDPGLALIRAGGWSADSRSFFFTSADHGYFKLHAVDQRGLHELDLRPGTDVGGYGSSAFETARSADVAIFGSGDFNHVPDLFSWRRSDNSVERLTNLNPIVNDHPLAEVENISWQSADRKWRLQGFLLTPRDARKAKLPLIVYVNGGPSVTDSLSIMARSITGFPWPDFLNRGYAIFLPNTRGRDGFGKPFRESLAADHSMQRVPATDVISGVSYLIEQGRVDPNRVGITAYSYGGGVAAYALALSSIFKAASIHEAVALCPPDPYTSDSNSIAGDQIYGATSSIDPKLWNGYLKDYPSVVASSIKTPVLLRFGIESEAQDQGRPFYEALQLAHVPSELVIDPRTSHAGPSEPLLVLDGYRRNLEWFDYWLGGIADGRMLKRYGPPQIVR